MSTSLEDIWDEPLLEPPRGTLSPPRTPQRQKSPSTLFLSPIEDRNSQDHAKGNEEAEIDALFSVLDEPTTGEPSRPFDVQAYRREAEKRATKEVSQDATFSKYAIQSSSPPREEPKDDLKKKGDKKGKKDDDEPKERKKLPKLDENRLLSKEGFPALIQQVKDFKPRGKGHEVSDLNRLMNIYQYWAHQMYPKTQFSDTVQRVEKLCHSKRMMVSLRVWHDDFHGTINGIPREELEKHKSDDEAEGDDDAGNAKEGRSSPHLNGTSRAPSSGPDEAVSRPPSSVVDPDDLFDAEMDAIFDQLDEQAGLTQKTAPQGLSVSVDEDAEMWAEFGEQSSNPPRTTSSIVSNVADAMDDDDDAWEALDAMEGLEKVAPKRPPVTSNGATSTQTQTQPIIPTDKQTIPTVDEDWDDMYV